MRYPMGYPVPSVPWDGTGMGKGEGGGAYRPTKKIWYGISMGLSHGTAYP